LWVSDSVTDPCMPRVAHAQGRERSGQRACHVWHMRRAGAERAACLPHVACAPGRGRSVRCACHVWHVRRAGGAACQAWHMRRAKGGACGVRPRVARATGRGGRSVRCACHTWHVHRAGKLTSAWSMKTVSFSSSSMSEDSSPRTLLTMFPLHREHLGSLLIMSTKSPSLLISSSEHWLGRG